MQKKPLKVQPARKIYLPKYPSFKDKNPLLHPDTRPYPFSLKFINWASTGGLASIMLLGGGDVLGQVQKDSLYNPFPLENARVPYQTVSFGTGMPERLKSEEVRKAIMNAFTESGIELDEEVYLDNGDLEVQLTGYNNEEQIGFLLIDYNNMDGSFRSNSSFNDPSLHNLKKLLRTYKDRTEKLFLNFLNDKDKTINNLTRYSPKRSQKIYAESLESLRPIKESLTLFKNYKLKYDLESLREHHDESEEFSNLVFQHIDQRFSDSPEKFVLLSHCRTFSKKKYHTERYSIQLMKVVKALKQIETDSEFITNYFEIINFLNYYSDSWQLRNDPDYQRLKLRVMDTYPVKKWMKKLESLDNYQDRKFVSLREAKTIDKRNKAGKELIAPISIRDELMIVPNSYLHSSDELREKSAILINEYNEKNGMTEEILARRKQELNDLSHKYSSANYRDLSREKKDSIRSLKRVERERIEAKYKAMEKLTDEERAEFKIRFAELREQEQEWRKANEEIIRMKALRKLEDEVKIYIKWAKSQIGN